MDPRIKRYASRAGLGALVLGLVVATGTAAVFHRTLDQTRTELGQAQESVGKLQAQVAASKKAQDKQAEQVKALTNSASSEQERLRSSVEAFAKQAASCDAIKRSLHLAKS